MSHNIMLCFKSMAYLSFDIAVILPYFARFHRKQERYSFKQLSLLEIGFIIYILSPLSDVCSFRTAWTLVDS